MKLYLILCFLFVGYCQAIDFSGVKERYLSNVNLDKSVVVPKLLEYFKHEDSRGIPVLDLPDVIEHLPNMTYDTLEFTLFNHSLSGHNGLKLEYVLINATSERVAVKLSTPMLSSKGKYSQEIYTFTYFITTTINIDDFLVVIKDLDIDVDLAFGKSNNGQIMVPDLMLSIRNKEFLPEFKNIGGTARVAVAVADQFWGTLVDFIVSNLVPIGQEKINNFLNSKLDFIIFPLDLTLLDFMVSEERGKLAQMKHRIPSHRKIPLSSNLNLMLKNIEVGGLTTIHRSGEISVQYIDNKLYVVTEIGMQNIEINADYDLSMFFTIKSGRITIKIDSITVHVDLKQDANVNRSPFLRRLKIKLGNFAVHTDGEGAVDYVLEAALNIAPNVFRDKIMDIISDRLQQTIQSRYLFNFDTKGRIMKLINK